MPPSDKKEKILIIEGASPFGGQLADTLRSDGYTVSLVSTADEGLKGILDTLPRLVILGLVISGGDAYDVLEKKQAEPLLSKIPVFLLSTQGAPINMRRVPPSSVAEFIVSLEPDPAAIVRMVNVKLGHGGTDGSVKSAAGIDATSAATKKKILWVEDDKLIGSILEKKFASSGLDLIHAVNGQEALDKLSTMVPDAIIIDLILPGMGGFEVLQKIRAMDGRLDKVPVMILSNLSKPSDIERARVMGAVKFMVKAASSLDQIVAEVKKILG
jgi:DNA-binding response OmpR family regulator